MSGSNGYAGYAQLRRGILEHVRSGKLSPLRFATYTLLILEADSSTGVAFSSAKSLAARYGIEERYARTILEDLEKAGCVRRFCTPGKHGEYPILVNKYIASTGARKGLMVNAINTADWRHPVFDKCEEGSKETCEDNAPYQGRERETTSSPSATSPANGAFKLESSPSNGKGANGHKWPSSELLIEM